jgi:hypothetical protein
MMLSLSKSLEPGSYSGAATLTSRFFVTVIDRIEADFRLGSSIEGKAFIRSGAKA